MNTTLMLSIAAALLTTLAVLTIMVAAHGLLAKDRVSSRLETFLGDELFSAHEPAVNRPAVRPEAERGDQPPGLR